MHSTSLLLTIAILSALVALCSGKVLQVHSITRDNATHLIDDSFYPGSVLKTANNEHLVYVSYPRVNNDTSVKLARSTDNDNRSCEILLPRVAYLSTHATCLGNGKIVVALVEETLEPEEDDDGRVRFYVVDLRDCGYEQFVERFGNATTLNSAYKPLQLVPYKRTFDVLAKSTRHCVPTGSLCMIRFTDDGERAGVRNFPDMDTTETSIDLASVHPLREYDWSEGFVYVSKQSSTLRVLDANLKSSKASKTPGYLIGHSVLNGDIGVCYDDGGASGGVECVKVDSRLKIKARVALVDANYFGTRRLYNLLDGSSLLVSLSRGRLSGTVRRLGADGKLASATTLLRYDCRSLNTEPEDYFAELLSDVYCFSYVCRYGVVTHCTTLPANDDGLPSYLTSIVR